MNKLFRESSAVVGSGIAAVMVGSGTSFAVGPVWQTQPTNGVFDNFLIVVLGGVLLALFAALAGGTVIAVLATGISRFFRGNLPTDEEMAEVQASLTGAPSLGRRLRITPSNEPFILAAAGFAVCFVLGSIVLAGAPKPVQGNAEAAKPASAGLPREGDFTKIVAGLPPGKAANGAKLYVSAGCSGCHSQEKDKRLVGPSFYGVYDRAKTREKGFGPKEYVYQSIVNPNAYVVDTFQPNIMPQTFATQFSPQQISDILTWIEQEHQGQQ